MFDNFEKGYKSNKIYAQNFLRSRFQDFTEHFVGTLVYKPLNAFLCQLVVELWRMVDDVVSVELVHNTFNDKDINLSFVLRQVVFL